MVDKQEPTAADLVHRAHGLVSGRRRALLGIVGPPGVGKTTFADALADRLRADRPAGMGPDWVVRVPMDGYHLADCELARLGRLQGKGAPNTFDVAGYVALLERLTNDRDEVVYAPSFERDIEQPIAGSIPILPSARLVITEGNYLLLPGGGWPRVHAHLDEVWYLELADAERRHRLVARHERFGKSAAAARAWVEGSDQRNADIISGTSHSADLSVPSDVLGFPEPSGMPIGRTADPGVPRVGTDDRSDR